MLDAVQAARREVSDPGGGLQAKVSGPAGFQADAIAAGQSINGTLLAATAGLVFLLLLLIYRSPIFWALPLLTVGAAELSSRALGYSLSALGVTINGQTAGILPVLVFGAGTDYALLLVARYREELRLHDDRHVALARALRTAGPAILASGLTVVAALLCLTVADVDGTASLGVAVAVAAGVAVAMLTLLPALLAITGRWIFWPFIPRAGTTGQPQERRPWRRLGAALARRPRAIWATASALLAVLALGLTGLDDDLTRANAFRGDVESVQGQQLLTRSFPAGTNAPTEIVVPDPRRAPAVADAVADVRGVVGVQQSTEARPVCCSTPCSTATPTRPPPWSSSPPSARTPSVQEAPARSSAGPPRSSATCASRPPGTPA